MVSAQVRRGSLACLKNSKQQEQNLTNILKWFHEFCILSDEKSLFVPQIWRYWLLCRYIPCSGQLCCPPGEYFVMLTWKGRGIAGDVALLFLVIRCKCSSTWPLKRSRLCSFPANERVWQLPTFMPQKWFSTYTLYLQLTKWWQFLGFM